LFLDHSDEMDPHLYPIESFNGMVEVETNEVTKSREITKRSVSIISCTFDMECSVKTIESITKTASRMGLEECSQCQIIGKE
jgi:hypothetical protein